MYQLNSPITNGTALFASRDGNAFSLNTNNQFQGSQNIQNCDKSNLKNEHKESNTDSKSSQAHVSGGPLEGNHSATPSHDVLSHETATLNHTPHPEHVAGRFVRSKRPLFKRKNGLKGSSNRSKFKKDNDCETQNSRDVQRDNPATSPSGNVDNNEHCSSLWQPWL